MHATASRERSLTPLPHSTGYNNKYSATTAHSNNSMELPAWDQAGKCRRLYLTMKTALALELPAERFGEECKAQEGRVNVLVARLRQELLHAADIVCAPFCAGVLLDTLLGCL